MNRNFVVLCLAATCGLWTASARADTFGVNFTDTAGNASAGNPQTEGFSFTTNSAITVTELALFDDSQNGLVESHPIGLYNSSGTLLVSGTIAAGTVDPLDDKFRVISVTPTALAAGQTYYIGALFQDGIDSTVVQASGFSTPAAITFDNAQIVGGTTLSFPRNSFSFANPGFFGPNFKFTASVVPEPATVLLLVTVILALAADAWRKTRRVTH